MELDITQAPGKPRPQFSDDDFTSLYPASEGPQVPVNPRSVSLGASSHVTSPAPTSAVGPRRSLRGWQPSQAALENLVNCLADNEHPLEAEDLTYVTQDPSVPRHFNQLKALSPSVRQQWLDAMADHCKTFLSIPAVRFIEQSQWTAAPPIRLQWVYAIKPLSGEKKARLVM